MRNDWAADAAQLRFGGVGRRHSTLVKWFRVKFVAIAGA